MFKSKNTKEQDKYSEFEDKYAKDTEVIEDEDDDFGEQAQLAIRKFKLARYRKRKTILGYAFGLFLTLSLVILVLIPIKLRSFDARTIMTSSSVSEAVSKELGNGFINSIEGAPTAVIESDFVVNRDEFLNDLTEYLNGNAKVVKVDTAFVKTMAYIDFVESKAHKKFVQEQLSGLSEKGEEYSRIQQKAITSTGSTIEMCRNIMNTYRDKEKLAELSGSNDTAQMVQYVDTLISVRFLNNYGYMTGDMNRVG